MKTEWFHELRRKTAEFDAKLIADVDKLTTGNAFLDYALKAVIFRPIVVGFSMTSGGDPGRALASAKEWDGLPGFSILHQIGNISEEGLTWGNGLGLVMSLTDIAPGVGAADNVAMGGIKIGLHYGDEVADASKVAIKTGKELVEETGERAVNRAQNALRQNDDLLYRGGDRFESASRLDRKAKEAQEKIGVHGVSTSTNPNKVPGKASAASRADVEQHFSVEKTGRDPDHYTVVLPDPVDKEVARRFNELFGRSR